MSMLRFKVAKEAFSRKAVPVNEPKERPSEYFGKYVFNREKMFKYLPKKTYEAVIEAIDNSTPLSREVADSVAAGMRKWALEMGLPTIHIGFTRLQTVRLKSTTPLSSMTGKAE